MHRDERLPQLGALGADVLGQARAAVDPVRRHIKLDTAETDAQRLVFIIKHILDPLLARLASRGQALVAAVAQRAEHG